MSEVSVSDGCLHVFSDGVEVLHAVGEALLSDRGVLSTVGQHVGLTWDVDAYDDCTLVRLRLTNQNAASIKVEQLRPLVARRGYAALPLQALRILQTGWQSWSRAHPPAP